MPKLKTKSGAKKRFRVTGSGHVKMGASRRRHGMSKRTNNFMRNSRGPQIMEEMDAKVVKRWMPYD